MVQSNETTVAQKSEYGLRTEKPISLNKQHRLDTVIKVPDTHVTVKNDFNRTIENDFQNKLLNSNKYILFKIYCL